MVHTTSKTQTVTNTQLAVAVVAAFLAGGLAFAAAPAQQPVAAPIAGACVLSEASMVYTHAINKTRQLCPNNGYWGARFTCTDRKADTVNVGVGNPCVTQEQILAMARAKCADQTHSCVPRGVAVAATSTLSLNIDNNYLPLQNDRYALSGTSKFLAGRIRVQAQGEEITLRDLAIEFVTNTVNVDLPANIDQVMLYTDPSMADNTQISITDFQSSFPRFQDVNYRVNPAAPTYLYVGLRLNSFGIESDSTSIPSTSFKIAVAQYMNSARGNNSGINANINVGNTRSNDITIAPIKITNVSSNFAGGAIVGGNQTLGTFQITADGGRNTDQFGNITKAHLLQLSLQLITDVGTGVASNTSALQLCRIESGNCITLGTPGGQIISATTTIVTLVNAQTGTSSINISAFADSSDEFVDSGETANFAVKGTLMNTNEHFAQVKIVNLNTNGLVYGFDQDDNEIDDYFFYDIRKDMPRGVDYPNVVVRALQ